MPVMKDRRRLFGIMGEIAFQGYQDISYYDVTAVHNPNDFQGVHVLVPRGGNSPKGAGCIVFPCDTTIYQASQVEGRTYLTTSTEFDCYIGPL
jgi:hypothetical protein